MTMLEAGQHAVFDYDQERDSSQRCAWDIWEVMLLATTCESEPSDEEAAKFPQAFTR